MESNKSKLVKVCPVFLSENIQDTVAFYTEKLGFKSARHYDKTECFATIYRDEIELIIVQAQKAKVQANIDRFGVGEDAYFIPETLQDVDCIYQDFQHKGVKIIHQPHFTDYGSYEFRFEDSDGRQIGVGRIADKAFYFHDSDFTHSQ